MAEAGRHAPTRNPSVVVRHAVHLDGGAVAAQSCYGDRR